jgi:hypothetical protein
VVFGETLHDTDPSKTNGGPIESNHQKIASICILGVHLIAKSHITTYHPFFLFKGTTKNKTNLLANIMRLPQEKFHKL